MAYGDERPQYDKNQYFHIPPDASFILGDCTRGKDLENAVQYMHAKYDHPKQFDFIVVDRAKQLGLSLVKDSMWSGPCARANEPRFLHPTFTDDRILTYAFGHAYHARCRTAARNAAAASSPTQRGCLG
ncbi:putative mt-a70 family protein [Lasiodiplodia theobromae]|nr:putative mt-a70 family protein [Lasiodiplodia theobromae]